MKWLATIALVLTGCASPADRELRKWLPPDATIEYRQVTEYGVRHRARFVVLPTSRPNY